MGCTLNILIRTDGAITQLPPGISLRAVAELIGADALDTVTLHWLAGPLHVMLVDDNGHASNKPVNVKATRLYLMHCRPGARWKVRGDVAVVEDREVRE